MKEREQDLAQASDRLPDEQAAEPSAMADGDAPAASEENEGLSTVLSAGPLLGVQDHAGEK